MTAESRRDITHQLSRLLDEMIVQAVQLKSSLKDEKSALQSQDLDSIDAAVKNKAITSQQLQDLDENRLALCHARGFDAGEAQMDQLIDCCNDTPRIRALWDRLMVLAAESNALNMTNGAIIRARQQQFESSLCVLRGVTPEADTYGRHGGDSNGYGHRSLAQV